MKKGLNIYQKIGIGLIGFLLIRYAYVNAVKNRAYRIPQPPVDPNYLDPGKDYVALAARVYDAVAGIDWTSKKAAAFNELIYLNDNEFVNVYNIYNANFARKGKTMRTDIESEWVWGSGITALKERFRRLNLP